MILAFVIGFVGQVIVTEVPFLVNTFGTTSLSIIPLLMNEFIVLRDNFRRKLYQ